MDQTLSSGARRPVILLVDDFEDALTMYGEYLEYRGYHVALARDGEQTISIAREVRPDLILLDLRMPLMSGTEALHALRADPRFAMTPIIALTAHALDNERIQALADGFDQVVAKPCLPDQLVEIVERYLSSVPGKDVADGKD